ncbi:hypothetical protein [Catellatospora sichuanensis]|uniref:hypothetical protein n=1 Tax=Catellatospora sichuanensis TaxID=1969805 RepID=UPI00118456A2|nr:hypothetical protein [Catellatospora sichuanensis]
MTSFPSAARRVRDHAVPVERRLWALRGCALAFGPYGYRATWHHLLVSARIPRRLDDDPESLVRAVDELEAARLLWRAQEEQHRRDKAADRAQAQAQVWRVQLWRLAYCPDPEVHPHEPLPVVVGRLIRAYASGADWSAVCPVCGSARSLRQCCPGCGVDPRGPGVRSPDPTEHERWRRIWSRADRT